MKADRLEFQQAEPSTVSLPTKESHAQKLTAGHNSLNCTRDAAAEQKVAATTAPLQLSLSQGASFVIVKATQKADMLNCIAGPVHVQWGIPGVKGKSSGSYVSLSSPPVLLLCLTCSSTVHPDPIRNSRVHVGHRGALREARIAGFMLGTCTCMDSRVHVRHRGHCVEAGAAGFMSGIGGHCMEAAGMAVQSTPFYQRFMNPTMAVNRHVSVWLAYPCPSF
eukprot:1141651-Pelagomonas_calceolata.AAC.7